MNYQKIYNDLIESRLLLKEDRKLLKKEGLYFEKHHILPKSKGGLNNNNNLVLLTAREHFLAHWLLWRIYRDRSMALAFHKMLSCNKNQTRIISSRGYSEAREAFSITNKGNKYGVGRSNKVSEAQKINQSIVMKGRYDGQNNPFYGKTHSEETKSRIRESHKSRDKVVSYNSRLILDYNSGIFFSSLKEASLALNMNYSTLRSMLNGENKNKTSLKYI